METKTSKAVALLKDGQLREALAIFRTFKVGFSKDERRSIQIASEVLNGSDRFYRSIGIDTAVEVEKATSILRKRYMKAIC